MRLKTYVCVIFSMLIAISSIAQQQAKEGVAYGGMSLVRQPQDVSNQYFVMFKTAPGINERNMILSLGATILYEYSIIPAYAIQVPNQATLKLINMDRRVEFTDPVQVYYALGSEDDPEMTDVTGDQVSPGDATQDIVGAWIEQLDNSRLQFTIKVSDLSAVNPTTGDGLPVNGVWKIAFTLQNGGTVPDEYFVQMRKPESGAPDFGWGFVDENGINSEQGAVDQGTILPGEGKIVMVITNAVLSGAPNQNGYPQNGDVLTAPYAEASQLVGAAGTGFITTLDRAPDDGPGRDYPVQTILPPYNISPEELEFENISLGESATLQLTVTNTTSGELNFTTVESNHPEFAVTPNSVVVPPSTQQVFTVTFTPTSEGRKLGLIIFTAEGSSNPVAVTVRGNVPAQQQAEVIPWGVDTVRAPAVWGATKGQPIKLAVLDTGIDSLHYELDARYKGGYNFVLKNPHPWDGHSHGTHVSGTIAAELNGVGVVGVAPDIDLYSLKVLSDAGSGTSADILAAIDWCVQNGMNIASMSLGGGIGITLPTGQAVRAPVYSPTEDAAYQAAYDAGLLIICASGNDGEPVVMYPAAYPSNMAIGAIGKNLALASFSNYGAEQEVVAPGVDVKSTVPMGTGRDSRVDLAGTSLEANELQFCALTSSSGISARTVYCGKGLSPSDFPASVAGKIALIQRGDSTFASKVSKAQDAGAIAAIIYNNVEGNFNGTMGTARDDANNRDWIPGVSLSMSDGQALVSLGSPIITLVNRVDDFNKYSGTSMATPHASAVAALAWSINPALTNDQVRNILRTTSRDLGVPGFDPQFGDGLIDAAGAVQAARESLPDSDTTPTLTPANTTLTWTGGPYTAVTADPAACTPLTCDEYTFVVNVPQSYYAINTSHTVRVHISWDNSNTDFDMYVYDEEGNLVNSSPQGNTTFEEVNLNQLTTGRYTVQVVAFATANASYSGYVKLGPPLPDQVRSAMYQPAQFAFTEPQALLGPDGVVFGVQDLEPRSAYDALGNIYVAAIGGTPAGTDMWKSMDGGNTFTYLGQPDGAQAASAMAGRAPGAGGGDEDIAISSSGRVYMASLWGVQLPLSITMCNSTNGGATWVANPVSQITPLVDRQWIAAYGDNTVYLTFQQLGVLLSGTNSIFCAKSTDGGLTFTQLTEVTTPQFGVQPDFQGNIAVDPKNGYIYTVFIGHPGNAIYVARSTDGGNTFIIKLVHQGPIGVSYGNVFPILAIDRSSGVHVVFSDGANVYLSSSANKGLIWTTPLRMSNGAETKTAIAPWVDAGDAGMVNVIWWGTSGNSLDEDAQWKVFMAQTLNPYAATPTVTQKAVTDVFHTGPICVEGTGCAEGTRSLAEYASMTVYHDGKAMIVYPDDQQTENPLTYFMKQTDASSVIMTVANEVGIDKPKETTQQLPEHFLLEQNYPNPFNPVTTIRYELPQDSRVSLKVYNMLGQEVATLVNSTQDGGRYAVTFDASNLSSGVYVYKLTAGSFVDVKRMLITK